MGYFKDCNLWEDITRRDDQYVYHGHRINIEHMSNEDQNALCQELQKYEINFEKYQIPSDSEDKKGDHVVCVVEPKSVRKLRYYYFEWTYPGKDLERPIMETIQEYEQRQQKQREYQQRIKQKKIAYLRAQLKELTGEDTGITFTSSDNTR